MFKLKKEEIVELYKRPNSMAPMDIWRHSGYFTSITFIKNCITKAIDSGEISREDIEVFEERNRQKEEKKANEKQQMKEIIVEMLRKYSTREEIAQEILKRMNIRTNTTEIGTLIKQIIADETISADEYKNIVETIRENAAKKMKETIRKKKEARNREEEPEL